MIAYQCEKNHEHKTHSEKPICMCPFPGCDGELLRAPGSRNSHNQVVDGKLRIRILENY